MRTFIISEIGVNHNGKLDLALELCDAAKRAGAHAAKFQTFIPEVICRENDPDKKMLENLALSFSDFIKISKHCQDIDIEFMSTPECPDTLRFLIEECGVKKIKIGSGDLTNTALLDAARESTLPVFLSTGMAGYAEIWDAKSRVGPNIVLLHCVSCYPAMCNEANLSVISILKRSWWRVGYSDHTIGWEAPFAAVALGAEVIEKHMTLLCGMEGPDHHMSAEPHEFAEMVDKIHELELMLGTGTKDPHAREMQLAKKVRKGPDGKRGIV